MSGETLRDRLARSDVIHVDAAIAVVADWLRSKAAQTRATARQLSSAGEIEAVAIAKMLDALADSLTPAETTEETVNAVHRT